MDIAFNGRTNEFMKAIVAMKKILALILTLYITSASAQSTSRVEKDLLKQLTTINNWWTDEGKNPNRPASSEEVNDLFERKLTVYLKTNPLSKTIPLENLKKEGLRVITSSDKKLRIFSWDENSGGTMHTFRNLFQYQNGNEIIIKSDTSNPAQPENDGNGFYSEIVPILLNGKKIYLTICHAIYCTSCAYQSVKLFTINGKVFEPVKLIKTTTGVKAELGFEFDFFSVVDRPERPLKLIYFDVKNKTIKIPVVIAKGEVTNRFITYKFTGKYFEKERK
jgi:hypothetical protein